MLIETQIPGITDHSALSGLTSGDDHTQYVLADGSRAMSGLTVNGPLQIQSNQYLQLGSSNYYIRENSGSYTLEINSNNYMSIYSYYLMELECEDSITITSNYGDVQLDASSVYAYNLFAPDGVDFSSSSDGSQLLYDASTDACLYSGGMFVVEASYGLISIYGYWSSNWNQGITDTYDPSSGESLEIEDGLIVGTVMPP